MMPSLRKFRESLRDIIKSPPPAPKMGRIPLPDIENEEKYGSSGSEESLEVHHPPTILAPTPRKPTKSLSSLSRGATPHLPSRPDTTTVPSPPLKKYHPNHVMDGRSASSSPELKKISRSTPTEKPPRSPAEKPPRSPHERKERSSGERRGSRSSESSRGSQDKPHVYRPADGHKSLEMPGNTSPTLPSKDAQPSKGILKPRMSFPTC